MADYKREAAEMKSHVGMGGAHICDAEGCDHFESQSMAEFDKHVSNHKLVSGHANCSQCGELVIFKDLDEKNRPTSLQVKKNLVFHPECKKTFFKNSGIEVVE